MMKYKFVVKNLREISVNRVIRENESAEVLLITGGICLLLISPQFLARFKREEGVIVAGERLAATWGHVMRNGRGLYRGWHCRAVDTEAVTEAAQQVAAARAYLKMRPRAEFIIKVHAL